MPERALSEISVSGLETTRRDIDVGLVARGNSGWCTNRREVGSTLELIRGCLGGLFCCTFVELFNRLLIAEVYVCTFGKTMQGPLFR